MQLLELSGELIDAIIDATIPGGIESFALSCRVIHSRAAEKLRRHRALKQRWKTTRLQSLTETPNDAMFNLFYALALDPLAALYITNLDLWDIRALSAGIWEHDTVDEEALVLVREMVMGSKYLKDGEDGERWWDEMLQERELYKSGTERDLLYSVVYLLSLLPNLKTLQLSPLWPESIPNDLPENKLWAKVLVEVMLAANKTRDGNGGLGKLQTLLPCMRQGYEEKTGMGCIETFMALKTIQELYLISSVSVGESVMADESIFLHWRFPDLTSPLRRIEMAYCCMDAEGISPLLSHTPNLEIFKYSHETKEGFHEDGWNPGEFVEAVARHCGGTLKELALTVDDWELDIIQGASSFLSFPNLVSLEIDALILRGPPIESGQRRHEDNDPSAAGERPWTEYDIPCIGTMLPPSIIEVHLNLCSPEVSIPTLKAILKNVHEERANRLKKLNNFLIREFNDERMKKLTEEAGVAFTAYRFNGDDSPFWRTLMPKWKREFEVRVGGIQFS